MDQNRIKDAFGITAIFLKDSYIQIDTLFVDFLLLSTNCNVDE